MDRRFIIGEKPLPETCLRIKHLRREQLMTLTDDSDPQTPGTQYDVEAGLARLRQHRRIVVLTDGYATPFLAKTAISLLRYRSSDVAAVLETAGGAKTAEALFGTGGEIPVVDRLEAVPDADAVYVGIAPPGGKLPPEWRPILEAALDAGIDLVSGLHDFLGADPALRHKAKESGAQLIDVRRNQWKETATAYDFGPSCTRIHTVGHDCTVGKMVVALEVQRGLAQRGHDTAFLATGQTGIMISGKGVPIDCVVADFVNGAAESLVAQHQHHDFVLIEGQGSLSHPAFSAVTLGLLHGAAPDGLIFCYEAGRQHVKGLDGRAIPALPKLLEAYHLLANLRHPCQLIGVAVNTRTLSDAEAAAELQRAEEAFGLPACDVYRQGADRLVDAAERLREEGAVS
jgi:uncharacterized NAD-dependent epimerase/dehydratase family protein